MAELKNTMKNETFKSFVKGLKRNMEPNIAPSDAGFVDEIDFIDTID
jgi:ribosomal protein S20